MPLIICRDVSTLVSPLIVAAFTAYNVHMEPSGSLDNVTMNINTWQNMD